MAHNYQKRWVFTWNADENDRLIGHQELQNFMNSIVKEGVFQLEKGKETGRRHYQGRFELKGPRTGKKQLLKQFSQLGSINNLTFDIEKCYNSSRYCTKEETRLAGPWFTGIDSYRIKNTPMTISLYKWQERLLDELKSPLGETFRDRKVIWIQDPKGGSGKTTFLKYLCTSQNGLAVKKLPFDRADRIRMMVCKITQKENVDLFAFDFTRTLGEDTHVTDLFQCVEEVKSGHVVSGMYGHYLESIFRNPFIIIFTNEDISKYCGYLSFDRWQAYEIREGDLYEIKKTSHYSSHDMNSRYLPVGEKEEKM